LGANVLGANVLGANVLGAAADAVATDDVSADDGCEIVVLAARIWVVLLVDVPAIVLDFRPDADESSASSCEPDVLLSVDFASTFDDAVTEDSVLTVPCVGVRTALSPSPFEPPDVASDDGDAAADVDDEPEPGDFESGDFESGDFESADFESGDFESADEDLEEPD
jgi:hypothetical protein